MADFYRKIGRFLGGYPDHYLSIDIETTGFGFSDPAVVPIEVGWAVFDRGAVVHSGACVLDWTRPEAGVDYGRFYGALARTRSGMLAKGNAYRFSIPVIEAGEDPRDVLAACADLVETAPCVVGHNLIRFDLRMLAAASERLDVYWPALESDRIVDTMALERARIANNPPEPTRTRGDWYRAVLAARSGGGLADALMAHGIRPDAATAHSAGGDAIATGLLLECYRKESQR